MRGLVYAAALLAVAAGTVRADEPLSTPPVGAQLTYRTLIKPRDGGPGVTSGQIYTYTVAKTGNLSAEGTITPVAAIYGCAAGNTSKECQQAAANPAALRDGDLVTLPIPKEIGEVLAKQSVFKTSYFLVEMRKFPIPAPVHPDDPKDISFSTEPAFILGTGFKCNFGKLGDFVPFGKREHVTLNCHLTTEVSAVRAGPPARASDQAVAVELSYGGAYKLTLPSGEWEVQKVESKIIPEGRTEAAAESAYDVATKLGITVRTRTTIANPSTHAVTETVSDLIAYKP